MTSFLLNEFEVVTRETRLQGEYIVFPLFPGRRYNFLAALTVDLGSTAAKRSNTETKELTT